MLNSVRSLVDHDFVGLTKWPQHATSLVLLGIKQ
jgi:hypothetical protein